MAEKAWPNNSVPVLYKIYMNSISTDSDCFMSVRCRMFMPGENEPFIKESGKSESASYWIQTRIFPCYCWQHLVPIKEIRLWLKCMPIGRGRLQHHREMELSQTHCDLPLLQANQMNQVSQGALHFLLLTNPTLYLAGAVINYECIEAFANFRGLYPD